MTEAITILYCVFGQRHEAESAAREAVVQRLAACANVLAPCRSHYMWDGLYEEQEEIPVLFKTTASGRQALADWLATRHSYDTPAILSWPAETTPAYAGWVRAAVPGGR